MKHLELCLSLFTIIVLANLTLQQSTTCQAPQQYDISNLTKPDYWILNDVPCLNESIPDPRCRIYFTFCKTLPDAGPCVNSSVCEYNDDPGSQIVDLGQYSNTPFTTKADFNGFYALFNGGVINNPFNNNEPCNLSVLFEFDCNKDVFWDVDGNIGQAPLPTNYSGISKDSCQYYYKFNYAGACIRINPQTTTVLTTQMETTEVNPTPSRICKPPKNYDISALTYPPSWYFTIDSGCAIQNDKEDKCNLIMSFCKDLTAPSDCVGSSGCIKYIQGIAPIIVANFSSDPFTEFEVDKFSADYPAGLPINNKYTNQTCLASISILFVCDLEAIWTIPEVNVPGNGPKPITFSSVSSTSCQINVTVPYSGACNQKDKGNYISAGSILLIIFFIAVSIYFIIGSTYNSVVERKTGVEVIPHFKFWSSTILYALEGFIFTWRFITCQTKRESKLKYDSI